MPEAIKLSLTLTRWFNNQSQRKTKHEAIVPSSSEWTFLLQQHRILLFFFFLELIATLRGWWMSGMNVLRRGSAHHYCLYRVWQMRSITLSRVTSHNHTDSLDSAMLCCWCWCRSSTIVTIVVCLFAILLHIGHKWVTLQSCTLADQM